MKDLIAACDQELADYWKMQENEISVLIHEQLYNYFGPLERIIRGDIIRHDFLRESYVNDFLNHDSEIDVVEQIGKNFADDMSAYRDILGWARKHYYSAAGLLGSANDFNPQNWKDPHRLRVLCGAKGCGKTTLLLYTISRLQDDPENNIKIIYINLETLGFDRKGFADKRTPFLKNSANYINTQFISEIDKMILELVELHGISYSEMIIERFMDYWKIRGIYPEMGDTVNDIRRKLISRENEMLHLNQHKYLYEFYHYIRFSIDYLQNRFGLKLIIMFDDIDRLESVDDARDVINYASSLVRKIGNTPIVISSREETLARLSDMNYQDIMILSLIPPAFKEVLRKRIEVFDKNMKMDKIKLAKSNRSKSEILSFVNFIVCSAMDRHNIFHFLSFQYDLDILLDMVRCILSSPFIDYNYAMEIKKSGKYLPWEVLLDTLQRYKYKNFYGENSFVLNVYDNEGEPTHNNCLIRIRVLQVISNFFCIQNRPVKVGSIYAITDRLGYERHEVKKALFALARQKLILTGRKYNLFSEDLSEIIPMRSITYYLNYLIYNYRYLQNILPITHIPFHIPMKLINQRSLQGTDLKEMDKYVLRFIKFIGECEDIEKTEIKDRSLFDELTRNKSLIVSLNESFLRQKICRVLKA